MHPARRIVGGLRRLLPVALCALGGHVVLYRSLRPSAGDHAYLAWYEPLVLGLSLAALVAFAALLLAALLGRESLRRRVADVLLPAARAPVPVGMRAARLALSSIGFLVTQETFERTVSDGRLAPAAFGPSQLMLVLAVAGVLATAVALVERSCSELIALVVKPCVIVLGRDTLAAVAPRRRMRARRRNALAELRGLRAPPLAG
jgi:hypothetical protein